MAIKFRREIGRNRRHAFLVGTRIRQWMAGTAERICAKFTPKTCLVLRSKEIECQGQRSKIKGQPHQGQNTRCALTTPPRCARNGTASLQITSRKQQARRFDRCRGVSGMRALGLAGYCWALPRISSYHYYTRASGYSSSKHVTYILASPFDNVTLSWFSVL